MQVETGVELLAPVKLSRSEAVFIAHTYSMFRTKEFQSVVGASKHNCNVNNKWRLQSRSIRVNS